MGSPGGGHTDVGGASVGKHEASVPQRRCVGDKDVEAEADAVVADPVKDLGGGVHLDGAAGRHEDETEGGEDDADHVSSGAAQNIEDLGNGELGDTTDDAAKDGDGRSEGVQGKCRGDVGRQATGGALLHAVDKVDDPDPDVGKDESPLGPDNGGGLHVADTILGVLTKRLFAIRGSAMVIDGGGGSLLAGDFGRIVVDRGLVGGGHDVDDVRLVVPVIHQYRVTGALLSQPGWMREGGRMMMIRLETKGEEGRAARVGWEAIISAGAGRAARTDSCA